MTTRSERMLADLLRGREPRVPVLGLRQGVIAATSSDGTCTLTLGAGTSPIIGVHCIHSYAARTGETVWVLANGPDLLVLGEIGSGFPSAKVYRTTQPSIASASQTALTWQAEAWDTDGMWTSGTAVIIRTPGIYRVTGRLTWLSNSTGRRFFDLARNGATFARDERPAMGGGLGTILHTTEEVLCAASDTIELQAYQNSGGALGMDVATVPPSLTVTLVGRGA